MQMESALRSVVEPDRLNCEAERGAAGTQQASSATEPAVRTDNSSNPWSQGDRFVLIELDFLKKVRIPIGQWLGAYGWFPRKFSQGTESQELLWASQSTVALYLKLKEVGVTPPIILQRAETRDLLPERIEPVRPDRFAQLARSAYEAVGHARQILNLNSSLHPFLKLKGADWFVFRMFYFDHLITEAEAKKLAEDFSELCRTLLKIEDHASEWSHLKAREYPDFSVEFAEALRVLRQEGKFRVANYKAQRRIDKMLSDSEEAVRQQFERMRQAADFLHDLANEARSKGESAGDRSTGIETRKALSVLTELASGTPLKAIAQVAVGGQVDDVQTMKEYKRLERLVARFSERVAKAVHRQYGPMIRTLDYSHLSYALRDWQWIDRVRDKPALLEAARRGLPELMMR